MLLDFWFTVVDVWPLLFGWFGCYTFLWLFDLILCMEYVGLFVVILTWYCCLCLTCCFGWGFYCVLFWFVGWWLICLEFSVNALLTWLLIAPRGCVVMFVLIAWCWVCLVFALLMIVLCCFLVKVLGEILWISFCGLIS